MSRALAMLAERAEGPDLLVLEAVGQRVSILPGVGGMVVDYRVPHPGESLSLLEAPSDLAQAADDPIRWGCPILFPFPNRIRGGRFVFGDRTHEFTESFLEGHHIHGIVYSRPWILDRCETTGTGAVAALIFRSRDFPEIKKQYPFPFELEVLYRLARDGLVFALEVRNVGTEAMPMGLGVHPYLRAPVSAKGWRGACRIRVPARGRWALEGGLPTGRVVPVEDLLDLREGRVLEDLELDEVFTYLERDSEVGLVRCELEDPAAGLCTVVEVGPGFREIAVYTPPDRPSVCIEPYTCVTDAPNLEARRLDTGLRVLEPGQQFRARMRLYALPLGPTGVPETRAP